MLEDLMDSPLLENKQVKAKVAGVVCGFVVYVLVFTFFNFFSLAWYIAFPVALAAGVFTFNYIPVHLHGRQNPLVFNPREQAYSLGPDDILGRVTKAIKIMRFEGHEWKKIDEEAKSHQLTYAIKFQEDVPVDDKVEKRDYEIFLRLYAYQRPETNEVSFLRLNFWEATQKTNLKTNEIIKQTTETIYGDLKEFDYLANS